MNRVATVREHSSGGVLWRPAETGGVEICLISTKGGSRWQLPKGHSNDGETEADAARREVREETGCDGEVQDDLGEISFWFFIGAGADRRRVRKSVRFFLLRYLGGETKDHDAEVDEARWFAQDTALRTLTFDSERTILKNAVEKIATKR